jgi:hypothetical protein
VESAFEHCCAVGERMAFEQVELYGASITTKADIGKGRSSVTVGLDAPLTSETAAALGCQEKLFTSGGEVQPDLFLGTSVFHLSADAVAVHLTLDGIAKREIELAEGGIRLKVRLVIRRSAHTQLRVPGFAMEVGSAPLICCISGRASQNSLGGNLEHVQEPAEV